MITKNDVLALAAFNFILESLTQGEFDAIREKHLDTFLTIENRLVALGENEGETALKRLGLELLDQAAKDINEASI